MTLSIVTITRNDLSGLKATMESILSQTYKEYEWIVIDGGSTDGTRDFLEQHTKDIAFWCSEPDEGIYYAQNKGIDHCRGTYVNFMNAGDTYADSHVLENIFSQNPTADILYGDWTQVYKNGKTCLVHAPEHISHSFFYADNICHQAMFIKTALLQNSPYDCNLKIYADWAKWMELSAQGKSFQYIPYNICHFLMGGFCCSSPKNNAQELSFIRKRFYPNLSEKRKKSCCRLSSALNTLSSILRWNKIWQRQ